MGGEAKGTFIRESFRDGLFELRFVKEILIIDYNSNLL